MRSDQPLAKAKNEPWNARPKSDSHVLAQSKFLEIVSHRFTLTKKKKTKKTAARFLFYHHQDHHESQLHVFITKNSTIDTNDTLDADDDDALLPFVSVSFHPIILYKTCIHDRKECPSLNDTQAHIIFYTIIGAHSLHTATSTVFR